MKEIMEEYGGVILAVLLCAILAAFLYSGFQEEGWLRTLFISHACRTYGG